MYDRHLESVRGAKEKHDDAMKAAAATRLKDVAAKLKKKRQERKEVKA